MCFVVCIFFFSKFIFFGKKYLRNTIRVTVWTQIRSDPFRPDLGQNCSKILSVDSTSEHKVKKWLVFGKMNLKRGFSQINLNIPKMGLIPYGAINIRITYVYIVFCIYVRQVLEQNKGSLHVHALILSFFINWQYLKTL